MGVCNNFVAKLRNCIRSSATTAYEDLERDFRCICSTLLAVPERLWQEIQAFNAIQSIQGADDPEMRELLFTTIEDALKRFGQLKWACQNFKDHSVAPGASVTRMIR